MRCGKDAITLLSTQFTFAHRCSDGQPLVQVFWVQGPEKPRAYYDACTQLKSQERTKAADERARAAEQEAEESSILACDLRGELRKLREEFAANEKNARVRRKD